MLFFEYHGGYVTERGVAPLRVLKGLDVIKDGKLGVVAADWNRLIQSGIGLQGAPERFHGGVVVAIASAAHTAFNTAEAARRDVVVGDILAASAHGSRPSARAADHRGKVARPRAR